MIYELIIEELRQKPFFNDKGHIDYKNEDLKKDVFDLIAVKIYENWQIEITGVNVRGIWEDLKREFKQDLSKKKKQPSGSGLTYQPQSPYFNNLSFLINHVDKHRNPLSSLENLKRKCEQSESNNVWSYPRKKSSATVTSNHENINLNQDTSSCTSSCNVPKWDPKAEMKLKNQTEVINITKEANQIIKQGSSKIVNVMEKANRSDTCDDYFTVFYEKFKKINENVRDDCLVNIVDELQKLHGN